jgi:hypothetical protein
MNFSKYHAKKTTVDGITFDSKKEAFRYQELKLLEKAGKITGLKLQPAFILLQPFTHAGIKYRGITYKADFEYFVDGNHTIEDCKGFKTKEYLLKKKLLLSMLNYSFFIES